LGAYPTGGRAKYSDVFTVGKRHKRTAKFSNLLDGWKTTIYREASQNTVIYKIKNNIKY